MERRSWWRWVLAGLAGAVLALAVGSFAQEEPELGCQDRCYEAEERCYLTCNGSDDPVVCEDTCRQRSDACIEGCP